MEENSLSTLISKYYGPHIKLWMTGPTSNTGYEQQVWRFNTEVFLTMNNSNSIGYRRVNENSSNKISGTEKYGIYSFP